jgi:hypothetical protein
MAGDDDKKNMTHVAWAMQHQHRGRATRTVPIEIGYGRPEGRGMTIFIVNEPKGGYGSYLAEIRVLPNGEKPQIKAEPVRPGPAKGQPPDDTDDEPGGFFIGDDPIGG